MGTGRCSPIRSARTSDGLATGIVDDATPVGQRLESFSQFTESTASSIGRSRRSVDGQAAAPHSTPRRPVWRAIRIGHRGDPLHGWNPITPLKGNEGDHPLCQFVVSWLRGWVLSSCVINFKGWPKRADKKRESPLTRQPKWIAGVRHH